MDSNLHHYFERTAALVPDALCVTTDAKDWSYAELDAESNRIAQGLILTFRITPRDRVAILLAPGIDAYMAILAILKCGATYIPIDPSFPKERIEMICGDAEVRLLIGEKEMMDLKCGILLASDRPACDVSSSDLAYIIYTSGTTGRPKGVGISHGNISNFLNVVSKLYGVRPQDRVYQGMTPSFDFSLEEVWPTWIAGAVLVPSPPSENRLLGEDLHAFLKLQKVSILYCVPTLLSTLQEELPDLHTLNVGGEACPHELMVRWSRPGRRILNTYGPTETTITASWAELSPDRPITIGRALPSYKIQLLNEVLIPVETGHHGEICVGGPGVAQGYINRPELTAEKFINLNGEPYYRTGDLGKVVENGEIEFLGRIDTQVKIRGYRVELGEIESLLSKQQYVAQALVNPFTRKDGITVLVAYLILNPTQDLGNQWRETLHRELKSKIPSYMIPAHFEVLDIFPTQVSGKADRRRFPEPASPPLGSSQAETVPLEGEVEHRLEQAWCRAFQVNEISATANFFFDLGGDSLSVAIVISELRRCPQFLFLSMGDIYKYPSIRELAGYISIKVLPTDEGASREVRRARTWEVALAGIIQFIAVYVLLMFFSESLVENFGINQQGNWAVVAGAYVLLSVFVWLLMPIAIKWLVIGRFKPGRYPLWGIYFLRWWTVRTALRFVPWDYLAGTPVMRLYLIALGAKIGPGTYIGSKNLMLPDLVTVGTGVHIGYNVDILTHEIRDGWLYIEPVTIGSGAFIGTNSLIFLGSNVGENAMVGELSLVPRKGEIPAGEYWQGSPARPAEMPNVLREMTEREPGNPVPLSVGWTLAYLAGSISLYFIMFVSQAPCIALLEAPVRNHDWWLILAWLIPGGAANVVFSGGMLALAKRFILPRMNEGIYPINSSIAWRKWYCDKLMDTSLDVLYSLYATIYTKYWLRMLGVKTGKGSEISTVSYFDPNLLTLGKYSFIADMATVGPAIFQNGWFSVKETIVGERAFVGNCAHLSQGCHMQGSSLLGVTSYKDGNPVAEEASWLGSPGIHLQRREVLDIYNESVTFAPPLKIVILRYVIEFFRIVIPQFVISLAFVVTFDLQQALSAHHPVWLTLLISPACFFAVGIGGTLLTVVMKWLLVGRYAPRVAPLWSPFVWRSELATGLYENISLPLLLSWFTGSPIFNLFLWLFGTRIGRRVFCDTNYITEFDMVWIGDDAAIAENVSLQTHLFEDRIMKLSYVRVGDDATIGHRAVVLYDTEVRAKSVLSPLSLVMKGESLPAGRVWQGIPAELLDDLSPKRCLKENERLLVTPRSHSDRFAASKVSGGSRKRYAVGK